MSLSVSVCARGGAGAAVWAGKKRPLWWIQIHRTLHAMCACACLCVCPCVYVFVSVFIFASMFVQIFSLDVGYVSLRFCLCVCVHIWPFCFSNISA